MRLPEDVGEEGAVRFRISAEQDDMAAVDHVMRLRGVRATRCRVFVRRGACRLGSLPVPRFVQSEA
jgi:hypothetical protein